MSKRYHFCVFGAGAIGGLIAFKLAYAGCNVSIIARGLHLEAIKNNGLMLESEGKIETVHVNAYHTNEVIPEVDFLFVTLKAHSIPPIAQDIGKLVNPNTTIVSGVNGVPHWYFYNMKRINIVNNIEAVDPKGIMTKFLPPAQIIGTVIYPACEISRPGLIKHLEGNRISLGEPSGAKTERIKLLSKSLQNAGFRAPIRTKIRDEVWVKLWGNLAFNPLSVLTGKTLDSLCDNSGTRAIAKKMMVEAQIIGERLGVKFNIPIEKRINGAAQVGAHKTSMLQDFEAGRPMEIDAIVTAVQELGKYTQTKTPTIDIISSLLKVKTGQN